MNLHLLDEPPATGADLACAIEIIDGALSSSAASDRYRQQIKEFVADHDDVLQRTCLSGHLTASALVVNHARDQTLVMLHTKLNMWLQPGGHADGEGNLAAVALREAWEETGIAGLRVVVPAIDCDVHVIPARGDEPEHLHLDVRFLVLAPADAVHEGNHESQDLRWVGLAELDDLATDASLRRLAGVGLARVDELS